MSCIKNFFFSMLCVYLGVNYSLSSDLSSSQIEDLTNNVYRVTSVPYSITLTGHIAQIDEQRVHILGQEGSKFENAFSFIKDKQENAFFILHMRDENLLSYTSLKPSHSKELKYQKLQSLEDKVRKDFLWSINLIPDKPNSIVTIKPLNGDKFLIFKKTVEKKDQGRTSTVYDLAVEDEDKISSKPSVSFFSFPEFSNFEWRLKPFYPSSGYSDFSQIIYDVGKLIEGRSQTKLVYIKTTSNSPHDSACLSVNCLERTVRRINPFNNKFCKFYKREIFRIRDVFGSAVQKEFVSSLKVTRAIETEQIFQTTIENCLSRSKKEGKATSKKNLHKQSQARGEDSEVMDQEGFSESLNTLLSVSIAHKVERSSATTQRNLKESSTLTGQNHSEEGSLSSVEGSHSESSIGQSQGESESKGSELSVGAHASVGFGGIEARVSASYGESNRKEQSKNKTSSVSAGRDRSTQQSKSSKRENSSQQSNTSVREKSGEHRTATGREEQEGKQRGTEESQQFTRQVKDARNHQFAEERSVESDKLQEFSLEESLSLSEVRSVTKKKNEKWFIERELHQVPRTSLQISFFEQVFEAVNYPFKARLRISGHVGFTFKDYISIPHNPSTDYREDGVWFLSPATILEYIKAPGYKKNKDGSVDYIVRGKINLKQPLNIFTSIEENPIEKRQSTKAIKDSTSDKAELRGTKKRKSEFQLLPTSSSSSSSSTSLSSSSSFSPHNIKIGD